MEQFEAQVASYQQQIARLKALEPELVQMETQLDVLQEKLPEYRIRVAQAKYDLDKAENPGFFARLMGRQEELLAKARAAYRDSVAALDRHRGELAALEHRIAEGNLEKEQLSGCHAAYRHFLEQHQKSTPAAHRMLRRLQAEDAIEAAWGISRALEQARLWMRQDVRYTYVSEENRKMALLDEADRHADEFRNLLSKLPDGLVSIGATLTSPSGYITGATMEYVQLDRLDNVLDQARNAREALRGYLAGLDNS